MSREGISHHSHIEWKVRWKYCCYECGIPLCIHYELKNIDINEFVDTLITFKKFRPTLWYGQHFYYKFYGLKLKRVCFVCFNGFSKVNLSSLRAREIGKKIRVEKTPKFVLYEWYKSFDRFLRRPDRQEYLLKNNNLLV